MKQSSLLLCVLVGMAVWLAAGCEVSDKGSPFANQPPTATLTYAPRDSAVVNHYVPIRWSGNDPDGEVVAYLLQIDNLPPIRTTATDTTIAFPAPNDSEVVFHTFAVRALDNEGALSEINASNRREFFTINFRPTAMFVADASVPNNASVGLGFRMTVTGVDPNPSTMTYCISIDDTVNWTCLPDSIFLFGDPRLHRRDEDNTIISFDDDGDGLIDEEEENGRDDDGDGRVDEDTRGLISEGVVVLSNEELLTGGQHRIYARVIDAGGAISPVIVRTVNVDTTQRPTLDQTVTGTYGGDAIFPDGSVYWERNTETRAVFRATTNLYRGEINAYRYQIGDSAWSLWQSSPELVLTNLPPGEYPIRVVARDIAGVHSDTLTGFVLRIVQQRLSRNIVIVDETRNGTGAPGSPTDVQVDSFYQAIFAGLPGVTHADVTTQGFVSPWNLKDAGLVMWHADDRAEFRLSDALNVRVLTEFLDQGGRLILSGWDVMGPFTSTLDSATFSTNSFARAKLRAISANRNTPRTALGFAGDNGFPGCQIDPAKVPPTWSGAMDRLWTFRPRGETIVIGRLLVTDPETNPLAGRPAAYIYDLSFRVAVFGVPLYYCYFDQVWELMRGSNGLVELMLTGLTL